MLATARRIRAGYAPRTDNYATVRLRRCSVVDRNGVLGSSPIGCSRTFAYGTTSMEWAVVGRCVTLRLIRHTRRVPRDVGGATRQVPRAGRPRSPRRSGGLGWAPRRSGRMLRRSARRLQRTAADRAGPRAAPDQQWPPVSPHTWGCGHSDTVRRRPGAQARQPVPVSRGLPRRNARRPEPARSVPRRAVSPRAHAWVPNTAVARAPANVSITTGSGPPRYPDPLRRTPRCRLQLLVCAWLCLASRFIRIPE